MHNIKFVIVAVMAKTKKQTKLAKWGEMSISILVFTHTEVGTEQKVIKLNLKIGAGSLTGVTCQQILCAYIAIFFCTRSRIRSAIYEPIPVLLSYVGSFCHLWAIPLLLTGFGSFVAVFADGSNVSFCLELLCKRFVRQEQSIIVSHAM